MKLSWGLFFSSLYCTASATSPSVSPETARLIIAQRLGLSRFHSVEHADAAAIRHINAYGGRHQKLFGGAAADASQAQLLMWIEDGDEQDATVVVADGSDRISGFSITASPAPVDNDRLVRDFARQAEALPALADPKKHTYKSAFEIESLLPSGLKLETYNDYLSIVRVDANDGIASEELGRLYTSIMKKAEETGFAVTMVKMPASAKHSKRAANPWGTYSVPIAKAPRRQNPEAFLSLSNEPSSSPAPAVSDLEDFPVVVSQANATGPVRGILPSCFMSQSACEKQTHGCSGHGECKLLHKGRGSGKDTQSVDCYGCACVATVERTDGKGMESTEKKTYWGGPACQKKDISVQFWLFVLVGVTLAFLVSSGIGMLYSMGAEELPSVIGAGVSGPVRK